ncbi:transcription termination factor Rho [Leucobacter sp.]
METNEETTTSTPAEETAPVRRRASRRVTAAAGATSETVAVEAAPAADAAPTAGAPATEAPAAAAEATAAETPAAEAPKKRATRSRKKAETPAADAASDAAASDAAASDAAAPAAADAEAATGDAPAEAPKKRATRSRKKAADAPEAPAAEASADQAAAGETAASEAPAAQAPAADASEPAAEQAEAAPAKRGRNRRAQSAEAAPEGEQAEAEGAKSESAKPEGEQAAGDGEKPGRNRRGRGRGQKGEAAEPADAGDQSTANDEGKGRGQSQQNGGDKGDKNGDSASRSSRTRQRDRKRRGQSDDLEPEITEDDVLLPIAGILDVLDNYAFVRTSGYLPGTSDVYVSLGQVKKYGLRRGDAVVGAIRQPRDGESGGRQKYNAIVKIDSVNARPVEENEKRSDIAELTPVFPQERLRLETTADRLLGRAIDVAAPIGLGQRSLLVLPARQAGVPVLAELAQAVSANRPEAHLMLVLADAQPEEATQLQRTIPGEVVVAAFDRPAEDQATIAELAVERAKRLVELGHDVVVLVDSLNRLARAYAQAQHTAARPGLDEIDEFALGQIKRLLAAARNVENGGSLTVLATVHAKTGIDADKMLLREVRAVVNNEIRFEKSLPGVAPAVDLSASNTRNADAMLGAGEAAVLSTIRAALSDDDASEKVLERLRATESNAALLAEIQRSGKF